MKLVTKDEQQEHYNLVLRNGAVGGAAGLGLGLGGVYLASLRFPAFRSLTIQFRAFMVTSASTVGAIIMAERASLAYTKSRAMGAGYKDEAQRALDEARTRETITGRLGDWYRDNRYTVVAASWVLSIAAAFALVSRNRYLTTAQKIVQARVYAQGLTLVVLLFTAVSEMNDARSGKGKWETVMVVDPNDPEHKHLIEKKVHKESYKGEDLWKDMVAAEERREKEREQERAARHALEEKEEKAKNPAQRSTN